MGVRRCVVQAFRVLRVLPVVLCTIAPSDPTSVFTQTDASAEALPVDGAPAHAAEASMATPSQDNCTAPSQPTSSQPVVYPEGAKLLGQQGEPEYSFTVAPDGHVVAEGFTLVRSTGFPALDAAGVERVLGMRFRPATCAGVAVAAAHRFRVVFRLSESEVGCISPVELPGPWMTPRYPADARQNKEEGSVELVFWVDQHGSVQPGGLSIMKSSGYPALDGAALQQMLTVRFTPGVCDGQQASMQHAFRFTYELDDTEHETSGS